MSTGALLGVMACCAAMKIFCRQGHDDDERVEDTAEKIASHRMLYHRQHSLN
jgi:hypothetical protein